MLAIENQEMELVENMANVCGKRGSFMAWSNVHIYAINPSDALSLLNLEYRQVISRDRSSLSTGSKRSGNNLDQRRAIS